MLSELEKLHGNRKIREPISELKKRIVTKGLEIRFPIFFSHATAKTVATKDPTDEGGFWETIRPKR